MPSPATVQPSGRGDGRHRVAGGHRDQADAGEHEQEAECHQHPARRPQPGPALQPGAERPGQGGTGQRGTGQRRRERPLLDEHQRDERLGAEEGPGQDAAQDHDRRQAAARAGRRPPGAAAARRHPAAPARPGPAPPPEPGARCSSWPASCSSPAPTRGQHGRAGSRLRRRRIAGSAAGPSSPRRCGRTSSAAPSSKGSTPRKTQRQDTWSASRPATGGPTSDGRIQPLEMAENTRGRSPAGKARATTTYRETMFSPAPKPCTARARTSSHIAGGEAGDAAGRGRTPPPRPRTDAPGRDGRTSRRRRPCRAGWSSGTPRRRGRSRAARRSSRAATGIAVATAIASKATATTMPTTPTTSARYCGENSRSSASSGVTVVSVTDGIMQGELDLRSSRRDLYGRASPPAEWTLLRQTPRRAWCVGVQRIWLVWR